ncbi:MAG: chromate transporter, partial [Planctomycetota bacterium]
IPFVKTGLEMVQYAIFAMIIAVAIQLVNKDHIFQFKYIIVVAASFALFFFTRIHPSFIIICAGLLGGIIR